MKKYVFFQKAGVATLFAVLCANTTFAQKMDDSTLKINVKPIENSVAQLERLEPIAFNYDMGKNQNLKLPSDTQYGFSSESLKNEFPTILKTTSKSVPAGKNQIKYTNFDKVEMENLIPVLVSAIKEQQAAIDQLKKEVAQLKAKK